MRGMREGVRTALAPPVRAAAGPAGGGRIPAVPALPESMKNLAGAVRELLKEASTEYPRRLLRMYRRELDEAVRTMKAAARERRYLYAKIGRQLGLTARDLGLAGETRALPSRSARRRGKKHEHKREEKRSRGRSRKGRSDR
ncbi:MAG: hypothetical protein BAA04_02330 [Firmicutes bacterium ZCTH02-B6]|mgnify:CR=1 FL=1|nr:MAG: hypothetical protein BAA04_02330 [Firmicutes bacterium ZCTH02-B6]